MNNVEAVGHIAVILVAGVFCLGGIYSIVAGVIIFTAWTLKTG